MHQNNPSKIIIQRLTLNQTLKKEMQGLNVSTLTLAKQTNQTTLDVEKDLDNSNLPKSKFNLYQRAFLHISNVLKNYERTIKQ